MRISDDDETLKEEEMDDSFSSRDSGIGRGLYGIVMGIFARLWF